MNTISHTNSRHRHRNLRRIWDDVYRVTMHSGDMRSIAEQQARPDLLSGDKRIDRAQKNALAPCLITIDDMVEYFREGIQFYVEGPEDALKILTAIMDHTGTWREATQTTLNLYDAPMEDLILMEEFAASIYEIAKYKIHENTPMGDFVNRISATTISRGRGMARNAIINGGAPKVKTQKTNAQIAELAYEPNTDLFRQALTSMGGPGNGERRY